jgi:hypothetical protein
MISISKQIQLFPGVDKKAESKRIFKIYSAYSSGKTDVADGTIK